MLLGAVKTVYYIVDCTVFKKRIEMVGEAESNTSLIASTVLSKTHTSKGIQSTCY